MRRILTGCCACLTLLAGCNEPNARLNAPPHGEPTKTADSQGTYVYMSDNAILADMSLCDAHFLPHRSHLNAIGVERLSRMAQLIQAYGGTVCLNTDECDEGLVSQRMQSVREFLTEAGVPAASQAVTCEMAGGAGMTANEAMAVRASEGTYKPKAGGGNAPPPQNSSSSQK